MINCATLIRGRTRAVLSSACDQWIGKSWLGLTIVRKRDHHFPPHQVVRNRDLHKLGGVYNRDRVASSHHAITQKGEHWAVIFISGTSTACYNSTLSRVWKFSLNKIRTWSDLAPVAPKSPSHGSWWMSSDVHPRLSKWIENSCNTALSDSERAAMCWRKGPEHGTGVCT